MKIINDSMKKRGFIQFGAVVVFLITTIGAYVVISESKHIFVGDTRFKTLYDYDKCPKEVLNIPPQNQIVFDSKDVAYSQNYKDKEGCI